MTPAPTPLLPKITRRTIAIVGSFGSGKSEVAVNLARHLAANSNEPVSIADLDIINPYFRSREAAEELATLGIKSLLPPGSQVYADLPIVIPQVKGAIAGGEGWLILDVGGDDLGARVLSSLRDAFRPGDYDLLLTINANRPFTADCAGVLRVIKDIESASSLSFTGLISNTHLLEQTSADEIIRGYELSKEVSQVTGLPIFFVAAVSSIARDLPAGTPNCPVLPLDRSLLKPWERKPLSDGNQR